MGAVHEALNECMPQNDPRPLPTDHANALSNLKVASSNQKKEIKELSKAVLALTKEVKDLKNNRTRKKRITTTKKMRPPATIAGVSKIMNGATA